MGIEFWDLGYCTQNWIAGCIVFAVSCFDWVMIILDCCKNFDNFFEFVWLGTGVASGVGGRVQAHPQKFWFGENPGKISENPGKTCGNLGKVCGNLGKVCENLCKIPENMCKVSKNMGKKASDVLWFEKIAAQRASIWNSGVQNRTKTLLFGGHPKNTLQKKIFARKVDQNLFGQIWVLRPSNSSGRVSRIPHALISAAPASRRKLLVAARRVDFAFKCDARYHAVEFLLACNIALFLIEFVFSRNLFVTAWSWYGHFSKSLFSLNLWLVVYRLAVLFGIYPWTYCRKVIQQLSGTGHKFSETGLFEYQTYIELYLRNQDLLLGATVGNLGKFGQISFSPPNICLPLHLWA